MKIHFWAGDFGEHRIRKFACGRIRRVGELAEVDDLDEFKSIPIEKLCVGCRKRLFSALMIAGKV